MTIQNLSRRFFKVINFLIEKIISPNSQLYKFLFLTGSKLSSWIRARKRKQLRFSLPLTWHCNLNCTGCSVFSPLVQESFLDTVVLERDCARIAELCYRNSAGKKEIEDIMLYGGEPLLHPHIIDCIKIVRKYFAGIPISILTNGIRLVKMSPEFWEACADNSILVYITRYPITIDTEAVKTLAATYNVRVDYWSNGEKMKTLRKYTLDENGSQDIRKMFSLCERANQCILLEDGKLYPCPAPVSIKAFNSYFGMNLEVTDRDYIDIFKVENIQDIFNFLCKPIPFCRYCDMRNMQFGIEWKVSKKDISEWV